VRPADRPGELLERLAAFVVNRQPVLMIGLRQWLGDSVRQHERAERRWGFAQVAARVHPSRPVHDEDTPPFGRRMIGASGHSRLKSRKFITISYLAFTGDVCAMYASFLTETLDFILHTSGRTAV
jgi:hypothetical protein